MSDREADRPLAVVFGCAGWELSADEEAFFRDANPAGFILFARNIHDPDQVKALVRALRATIGRADAPVLIDQEGGRVARLRPPHWQESPPARRFGELALKNLDTARAAVRVNAQLIATELAALGINVDCAPVLDLSIPGAHDVIGDRAFGGDPTLVATLGRAFCEGLLAGGVLPMLKHVPGHGRALADSHKMLPTVDQPYDELRRTDFAPFRLLADMPLAMTAHILFPTIDPNAPATTSAHVVAEVIRKEIGFDGLLLSDDLGMEALSGGYRDRTREVLGAGCDIVLHCSGDATEMRDVAAGCTPLTAVATERLSRALQRIATPEPAVEVAALRAQLDEFLTA